MVVLNSIANPVGYVGAYRKADSRVNTPSRIMSGAIVCMNQMVDMAGPLRLMILW